MFSHPIERATDGMTLCNQLQRSDLCYRERVLDPALGGGALAEALQGWMPQSVRHWSTLSQKASGFHHDGLGAA